MKYGTIVGAAVVFAALPLAVPALGGLALGGLALGDLHAADDVPTVEQIVTRTNWAAYYQGDDRRSQVDMLIKDPGGTERTRRLTILRLDAQRGEKPGMKAEDATDADCGGLFFYVYFHRPADVNKTTFLVHKHIETDDDRWLYLPALDLLKRIAASDERTSFVGSDFFYEDISGRNTSEDLHELVEVTDNYYVLRNTPKDPSKVEFASFKMWIHRGSYLPVKTEFYDAAGEKYREYTVLEVKEVDGHPTVVKASMKDLKVGSETIVSCGSVSYDVGLTEDLFTERYLRNAPTKFLR